MSETYDHLRETCADIARELETAADCVSDIIKNALDIEYAVNSRGDFLGARILVAFGGPNIWIDTRYDRVEGYWAVSR